MKVPDQLERLLVEIGSHQVVYLDKLFGPSIASLLRIYLDNDHYWVVEQDVGNKEENGFQPVWKQVARFDADPEES